MFVNGSSYRVASQLGICTTRQHCVVRQSLTSGQQFNFALPVKKKGVRNQAVSVSESLCRFPGMPSALHRGGSYTAAGYQTAAHHNCTQQQTYASNPSKLIAFLGQDCCMLAQQNQTADRHHTNMRQGRWFGQFAPTTKQPHTPD